MEIAPICLFVYNRPFHTEITLNELKKCNLSADSDLFIFCDGPKKGINELERQNIERVRDLCRNIKGFRNLHVIERDSNLGLGQSIIDGVNHLASLYKKIIVLEDDLVVEKSFLEYMNFYLNFYENSKNVWHISGFQRDCWLQALQNPVFFTHFMICTGWATWTDRWERFNQNIDEIKSFISSNKTFFDYSKLEISHQIKLNENRLNTWAIFWYSTIMMNKGFCLNTKYSLLKNIGDDGTGTNMGLTKANHVTIRGVFKKDKAYTPKKISETFISRNWIIQVYSKKSKLRFVSFKNFIFETWVSYFQKT
jgi:hypothetical protein